MKTSTDTTLRGSARARGWPLALTVLMLLAACAPVALAQPGEPAPGTARLRVLLYSGRPDPTVELDAATADQLAALVDAAPAAEGFDGDTVLPSILGYKGVLVETSGDGPLPRYLAAFGGTVELRDGEARFLRDDGRAVEQLLLEAAVEAGGLDEREQAAIAEYRGDKPPDV